MNKFLYDFLKSHSLYQYQFHKNSSSHANLLFHRKTKRGEILSKMVINKDKNKKWHLNLMENATKAKSIFHKVHRPNKRQNMLNMMFIKNISDVLSTGDIAPEILGHGIEINGVKISPCFQVLNVYWQIPPDSYESHEEISIALNRCAPRLRAELISRNVMGRVPHIFFIRDVTNARMAEFENAMKDIDLGPKNELSIIPDDDFTNDILVFKTAKTIETKEAKEEKINKVTTTSKSCGVLPQRPADMKNNVFGLDHDALMSKVMNSRTRHKSPPLDSAVIASEFFPNADLFDKIPGTPLTVGLGDRDKLLKQFQVERKMMKNQKYNFKVTKEDFIIDEPTSLEYEEDRNANSGDYVEEETPENIRH